MRIRLRSHAESLRILVVRTDRIGDVLLSTPVVTALKKHFPNSRLTFMVRELVAPLLKTAEGIDDLFIYDPDGRHKGVAGFFRLMEELKAQHFQIALILSPSFKITAAAYGVGIPHRLGPLSKIYSFLFLNRGTRQGRSQVEMHEADYNLQLLRKLGIRTTTHSVPTKVSIDPNKNIWAKQWLSERGWNKNIDSHARLIVVHPGMGGSALNWPENHYVELCRAIRREGHTVLVTGGPTEGELLERIKIELEKTNDTALFFHATSTVDELAALFSEASVVVAPSTGPLHIAVALGKPTVSFYPPIRVQSAVRWGPYLPDPDKASILVPEVYCGQDFKCLGPECNYYPCMKSIGPRQAMEELNRQLSHVVSQEVLKVDTQNELKKETNLDQTV